jgi:hypothetical protein
MMGEEAIKDLKFTETVVDKVEEVKPTNFLELLHTSNSLSPEVRTGLSSLLKSKKMTKADRLGIAVILRGAYVQCGFEQPGVYPDGKDIIARKEKEINEFLDIL